MRTRPGCPIALLLVLTMSLVASRR